MKNIAKALAIFHKHIKPIIKSKPNPFFKSMYASLDSILEEIKEPLREANLVFTQMPTEGGKLTTILIEVESGESIESTMDILITKNDPQAQGSAITYARRYALSAILGLATDEDDDGHAATPQAKPASTPAQTAKTCNVCGKTHNGPYPTCYDCFKKK